MTPDEFIEKLQALNLDNVFNPYRDICPRHDLPNAASIRSENLKKILYKAAEQPVKSVWIGRDLGYLGGRRTGLALTDDQHLEDYAKQWQVTLTKPTLGENVSEKTAKTIWKELSHISEPIFLWNVFPLHPHIARKPFTNRKHTAKERGAAEILLVEVIQMLKPQRIIAIGKDAYKSSKRFQSGGIVVEKVRHPSYGGQQEFVKQINKIYTPSL